MEVPRFELGSLGWEPIILPLEIHPLERCRQKVEALRIIQCWV